MSVYFQIQKKVFTKWINSVIQRANVPIINDLQEDLADGVILCKLLEILSGKAAPRKYSQHAKSRHHKIQNLSIALGFLNLENVRLAGYVPEDFVDGNLNKVLSVVWQIILKYHIQALNLPSDSPKSSIREVLLAWVRSQVKDYNIEIKDFLQSWVDGFAFSILVYKFAARTLEPSNFTKENALENLNLAFAAGEEHFGISQLLAAEDMLDKYLDELSVMTYVSFFPKAYEIASKAQEIVRAKRITTKATLELSKAVLSPRFPPSPRLSLPNIPPQSISPPGSPTIQRGPSSPRPSAVSILGKMPHISLVSLQLQQTPKPPTPQATSIPPQPFKDPMPTAVSPEVVAVSTPSPQASPSPRFRSASLNSAQVPSDNSSPNPSPSPSPRLFRHSPYSPRNPEPSTTSTTLSTSAPPASLRPSSPPLVIDESRKANPVANNNLQTRRNSVNRKSVGPLPRDLTELLAIEEGANKDKGKEKVKGPESGPSMLFEVRDLIRDINIRTAGERRVRIDEKAEKSTEKEEGAASPYGWRRATISSQDGTEKSLTTKPRWKVSGSESDEPGSSRKRAWTRGSLEGVTPVGDVGKRGIAGGMRVGTNANSDEVTALRAKLELMENKNEENLRLLDEAKTKLEKAANCLHGLMRRTQESSFIALDTELLHEWQRKREQKLKHLQSTQDENSTLKVAMDIMHEELLYVENENYVLQQNLEDAQAELAECHKSLASTRNERVDETDSLKFELRLALSEKEKLQFLLDKESKEHNKLQGFYDEDQKRIQDIKNYKQI